MPLSDYEKLQHLTPSLRYIDATSLVQSLQQIKSEAETDKIRNAAVAASQAFAKIPDAVSTGMTDREIFRQFKHLCLDAGVDDVTYLVGASSAGGYDDIIAPPGDRVTSAGDILILDTGCVCDGYFCDFDRDAALSTVKAGVTCAELYETMNKVLRNDDNMVGRMGHGLGMRLTETPSINASDQTVLLNYGHGKIMVHEENLRVLSNGYELLSHRAPAEIPVI